MTSNVDSEIEAIHVVLNALEPLDAAARASVLDYVLKRLNIHGAATTPSAAPLISTPPTPPAPTSVQPAVYQQLHIKDFKEQKQPRSAIEMAAIVAYYLENHAPEVDRKNSVDTEDLDTYFKIAGFKLPAQQRFTLVNARNAGYFDSAGSGEYRFNAVGHNLVVHSMPRKGNEGATPRKRTVKKKSSKKTTKKTSKKKTK